MNLRGTYVKCDSLIVKKHFLRENIIKCKTINVTTGQHVQHVRGNGKPEYMMCR